MSFSMWKRYFRHCDVKCMENILGLMENQGVFATTTKKHLRFVLDSHSSEGLSLEWPYINRRHVCVEACHSLALSPANCLRPFLGAVHPWPRPADTEPQMWCQLWPARPQAAEVAGSWTTWHPLASKESPLLLCLVLGPEFSICGTLRCLQPSSSPAPALHPPAGSSAFPDRA